MPNKKILILTMGCNAPHFQALMGAVKDTWAKPIIQGQYPDITWFGYTACDERHPNPYVDLNDHMIYVNCGDDLSNTYLKTRTAYEMVKDIVDFDWVVRTNTSVFVNVDKMLERLDAVSYDDVSNFGQYMVDSVYDKYIHVIVGFFYMMHRKMFEIGMLTDYDTITVRTDNNDRCGNDDIVMTYKIMSSSLNNDETKFMMINEDCNMYMYKTFLPEDDSCKPNITNNFIYTDDPDIINDLPMIRFRTMYQGVERTEKGHELEHIYELNDKLKRR